MGPDVLAAPAPLLAWIDAPRKTLQKLSHQRSGEEHGQDYVRLLCEQIR